MGGPATISTLDDPTPPEVPMAQPAAAPVAAGQQLVPAAPAVQEAEPAAAVEPVQPERPVVDVQVPSAAPGQAERPRAADIVQRKTGDVPREQINALTPKALQLAKRMGYYKLDNGYELRDQVALAVDAWLTAQGY